MSSLSQAEIAFSEQFAQRPYRVVAWWRALRAKPLALAAAMVLVFMSTIAIGANQIVTHDVYSFAADELLASPSSAHFFGTDEFGRDVFSRVVQGSRTSLLVGLATVMISTFVGSALGLATGYLGGWLDMIVLRLVDILMSLPTIVLAMAIVAARGQATENIVLALAIVQIPGLIRVVRASVLSVKERQFIESAIVVGSRPSRVMFRHILPNVVSSIIVVSTAALGGAILAEATLSFLGLGTPPPRPSWGGMLGGSARQYATQAPWLVIFPGIALSLVIFSFNLLGDGLRDILDPRLRGSR